MTDLYFLPISGQDEIGGGCYALVLGNDIFLFDAGAKYPYQNTLGIKKIVPDTNWLVLNKNKIKGIFIGEPSSLTTDGLFYVASKLNPNIPIYVTEIGKVFIDVNLGPELHNSNQSFNYVIIQPKIPFYVNKHKIIPFSTFSSVPLSVGFLIKDVDGDIVIINDFIISSDFSKLYNNSITDLSTLTKNVKLLVCGVGNVSNSSSFTTPSYQIRDHLYDTISNARGRVIVSMYDHELYYLYVLASVAKQTHRPLIIYSLTGVNIFSTSIKMKLFNNNNLVTLPLSEINSSDNAIIVIVAKISELYPILLDIVNEEDQKLTIQKDDIFILATSRIAGIEKVEADTIDTFTKSEIPMVKLPKTVLPVKASVEDHKFLIKLLKPKHIIPINGLYRNFVDYADNMFSTGIGSSSIHFIYNGEVFDVNNPKSTLEHINISEKYVGSNNYNNEIDFPIIYEREKMSTDGFANMIVLFSIANNKIDLIKFNINLIGVVDKSFLSSARYSEITSELKKKIVTYFDSLTAATYDNKEIKVYLKKIAEKYLEKQLNKKPLVLPILLQIKKDKMLKTN